MLTASIVTYNTADAELASALDSLESPAVCKVYVVDNSCNPSTRRLVEAREKCEYIPSANVGYGRGNNIAILRAMEEYPDATEHLVLNPDITFSPSLLPKMEAFMNSHPECGTLQPRIMGSDGLPQYSSRLLPTPFDLILRRFFPLGWLKGRRARFLLKHLDLSRTRNVPFHQGSFMLLRRSALQKVGLFDERFFMYSEDIDLTRRIHREFLTLYWPGGTVVHAQKAMSYKSFRMCCIHIVSACKYFNKYGWFFDSERRKVNRQVPQGALPYEDDPDA